jgi:hypothetical protein
MKNPPNITQISQKKKEGKERGFARDGGRVRSGDRNRERISPVRHQFRRRKFLCVDGHNRSLMPRVLELDVVEIGLETECESRLRWHNSFSKSSAESKHSRLRTWAWPSSLMDRYHLAVKSSIWALFIWRGIHRGPR